MASEGPLWQAVNALGGAASSYYDRGFNDAIAQALELIEAHYGEVRQANSVLAIAAPAAVTDAMIDRGLACYSEGGCSGLAEHERREVVAAIIEAALSSTPRRLI